MNNLIVHPDYQLYERKGEPSCSSLQVAEKFKKSHDNVLKAIRNLIKDLTTSKNGAVNFDETGRELEAFGLLNFEQSSYRDDHSRRQPLYFMTRDGFTMLTMGFTGKDALKFKVDYIRRFNEMEAFIQSLTVVRDEHPAFTEAVMLAHEEPKHYHFSNETDMINRIVLGRPAKVVREEHGLQKGQSIRPYLNDGQLAAIKLLQMADVGLLATMPGFAARKSALEGLYHQRLNRRLAAPQRRPQ